MEKANLKRLYTIGFHIYNILEMQTNRKGEQISGCQELKREWKEVGMATEEQHGRLSLDRNVLDCVNVSLPV